MKILIVDDSDSKINSIREVLSTILLPCSTAPIVAKSFVGALNALRSNVFDLLILDLVLPIRDNEEADTRGGQKVLAEITAGDDCLRPSHIICLTAFEEAASPLQRAEELSLVHIVLYNEDNGKWRDVLAAKAKYVKERLSDMETFPVDYKMDVAIVTSSPQVELRELSKLPIPFSAEFNQNDSLHYYTAEWINTQKRKLQIVACAAPAMGMTAACVTACKAIERWRPRFLVMSGIAAGTSGDQSYGDVLVAESAFDYGSGKILDTENNERVFVPSPKQLNIDCNLQALLQRWEREQLQMEVIWKGWHIAQQQIPKMHMGLLASGAAVIQSKDFVNEILRTSRKVVGLDMEAYAIFQAAHLARNPKPRVFVAKSICDFADRKKSDDWQSFAAYTSARFIYEFFIQSNELFT